MKKVNIVLFVVAMLFSLYVYTGAAYGEEVQPVTVIEKSVFVFRPELVGRYDLPTDWGGMDIYLIASGTDVNAVGQLLEAVRAEFEGVQCPECVQADSAVQPEDTIIVAIASGSQEAHDEIEGMIDSIRALLKK